MTLQELLQALSAPQLQQDAENAVIGGGQMAGNALLNSAGNYGQQLMQVPQGLNDARMALGQAMNTQIGMPQAQAVGPTSTSTSFPTNPGATQNPSPTINSMKNFQNPSATSAPKQNAGGYSQYKVQSGDTLWGIAQKYLGDGNKWHELEGFHGDPTALQPGTVIHIPGQTQQKTATPGKQVQSLGPSPSNVSSSSMLG